MKSSMVKARVLAACSWAVGLLMSLSFSSCLDEHPKDQLDADKIYGTPSDIYVNAVASLYNYIGGANEGEGIQGTCRGIYDYNTLTTDEAIIPIRGGDWYDGGLWNAMYQHRWTADDEPLYDTWKYLYKVIVLCNNSIDIIHSKSSSGMQSPILTDEQRNAYLAEVRAVRALMYDEAMDMFGRVPLVLSEIETRYAITDDETDAGKQNGSCFFVVDVLDKLKSLSECIFQSVPKGIFGPLFRFFSAFYLFTLAFQLVLTLLQTLTGVRLLLFQFRFLFLISFFPMIRLHFFYRLIYTVAFH